MHTEKVTHQGVIDDITTNTVKVRIQTTGSCLHCSSKEQCISSSGESRVISVENYNGSDFKKGDMVTLVGEKGDGLTAVFYAYFLPFLLVITTLMVANLFIYNELVSGLVALGILLPYYLLLWLNKKSLQQKFTYKITI
jgi:sigma-E factor negative regulatory protein RseC